MKRLLFLHGFLGNPEDFAPIIRHLSDFKCICLKLPGHGLDPLPEENFYADMINKIKTYIQGDTSLIGYSMGGRIAMLFSRQNPSVKTIILSGHPGLQTHEELQLKKEKEAAWIQQLNHLRFEDFLIKWYDQPMFYYLKQNTPIYESMLKRRKTLNPEKIKIALQQLSVTHQTPLWNELHGLPILFLFGNLDPSYQKIKNRFHDYSIHVKMIPNAGHAIHLEKPKRCADEIRKFISC